MSSDELNTLIIDGIGGDHDTMIGTIRFRLLINVESDGECYALNDRLIIYSSSFYILRILIATNYINYSNVNGDQIKLAENYFKNSLLY